MIQQQNATVIEMENSENDRDGDTENENTKKSEEAPLLNPNEQTDRAPSPRNRDKTKWIFEIFHGEEHVYGIRQIKINGSEEKFIGTPRGKAVHIELMDGKKIQTVTFSGLN